jgi:hypothetical protein
MLREESAAAQTLIACGGFALEVTVQVDGGPCSTYGWMAPGLALLAGQNDKKTKNTLLQG